jgi:nucleotide-binding universal stress UspA family protein/RimJ/RimL family protein N-acetyltransferase
VQPRTVTLSDGSRVLIRPIAPEDRDELAAGFERLSPESRYRRFFGAMARLSPADLDRLTQVDHHDHEALVAIDEESGRGVAVARFVRIGPEVAEPAVVVADDWQRRGLAGRLLGLLVERALEEGIVRFRAPVLAQNRAAIAVLRRLGETETTHRGPEVEMEIRLTAPGAARRDLGSILREVAAGTLEPARTLMRVLSARPGPPDRARLRDTIVVGTDGSEPAAAAVRLAGELAPALGVSVQLVAVHWPLLGDREAMDAVLGEAARELRDRGVEVTTHARRGDPAASLIDVAAEERARLILVGPRGRAGATQLLLGSVSETVAAYAPCDVMIVR